MKDIDLAIKYQLEGVTSTPLKSLDRVVRLTNLAVAYRTRFKRLKEMKDIDLSIKLLLETVSSIPLDSPDRLKIVTNLAVWIVFIFLGMLSALSKNSSKCCRPFQLMIPIDLHASA